MTIGIYVGGVAHGGLPPIVSPTDGITPQAPDSTPTGVVYKNGSLTGDSPTVTAISGHTGVYRWQYDPAAESAGDVWLIVFTVTIGTAPYYCIREVIAVSPERGTDSALTTLGATAPAGWINNAAIADNAFSAGKIQSNALTAAKFAADAITLIQNGLATAAALAIAQTSLTTLENRLTLARAGYLDNLNISGAVASQADVNALNQSASRRIIVTTQGQWERPDSGSATYFIEARTYDGDGAAVNADANPTITVTGAVTGSLSGNVSVISNPATGVYRWSYSQPSNAAIEAVRVDVSATLGGSAFPMSVMSQSCDFVSATWTTADASRLTAIYNKLPSRAYLAGTTSSTGAILPTDLGLAIANIDAQFDEILADLAQREANIRGADNDTLKTLSDQIDGVGGGGGGGGDATLANQTTIINHLTDIKGAGWSLTTDTLKKIRDAVSGALTQLLASVGVSTGTISGWPAEMSIGDSYTTDCNRTINIFVRDENDDPITSFGTHDFTDGDFTASVSISQGGVGKVKGTATYVDPGAGEGYLRVTIERKESIRAVPGDATVQITLAWTNAQFTLPPVTTRWLPRI